MVIFGGYSADPLYKKNKLLSNRKGQEFKKDFTPYY